eukprot:6465107-Amphidinium_carterae.1
MPAIAKPMPRPQATAVTSSPEAPAEPNVDDVLGMENDDNPDDDVVDEDEYHLGMLELEEDSALVDGSSPVMEDVGR